MNAIYKTLDEGQIGVFESPTGTGKTLSILCSTLTWLNDNRYPSYVPDPEKVDPSEPDWVHRHVAKEYESTVKRDIIRRSQALENALQNISNPSLSSSKRKSSYPSSSPFYGLFDNSMSNDSLADPFKLPPRPARDLKSYRIIYATRTHSQIAQIIQELRQTSFLSKLTVNNLQLPIDSNSSNSPALPLTFMPFGSRTHTCINDQVRNLKSSTAISDRCRELIEAPTEPVSSSRKRARNRCPYKSEQPESLLRDKALTSALTIEEIAEEGKRISACPYYAIRSALDTSDIDVLVVPYSAVLHRPTRESLNLQVDEQTVLVFDEAHNIVDTVCDLHSAMLTRPSIEFAKTALEAYILRYKTRLAATSLFRLRQLVAICKGFLKILPARKNPSEQITVPPEVLSPQLMLNLARVDNVNLYELLQYMEEAQLSKKLRGFVDAENSLGKTDGHVKEFPYAKQSIASLESFIRCVAYGPYDAKVAIFCYDIPHNMAKCHDMDLPIDRMGRLKFFVTKPENLFLSNTKKAHSILLLGGTLSPRSAIIEALFPKMDRKRINELECDHVVPADHIMTRVCMHGPTGKQLKFTYKQRQNPESLEEVGGAVCTVAEEVKDGMIVFFASYDLMNKTIQQWRKGALWQQLERIKKVFVEKRGESEAFISYQMAIRSEETNGAVLLAVMGGKLSEGINFSDELARTVVIIGMPFANVFHVETKEALSSFTSSAASVDFLENQCMKTVNQCIGRAVRHRDDYACVLLMDHRFGRQRVQNKLPKFLRRDLGVAREFSDVIMDVRKFFKKRSRK